MNRVFSLIHRHKHLLEAFIHLSDEELHQVSTVTEKCMENLTLYFKGAFKGFSDLILWMNHLNLSFTIDDTVIPLIFKENIPDKYLVTGGGYTPSKNVLIIYLSSLYNILTKKQILDTAARSLHTFFVHELTHVKQERLSSNQRGDRPSPLFGIPQRQLLKKYGYTGPVAASLTRKSVNPVMKNDYAYSEYLGQPEEIMAWAAQFASAYIYMDTLPKKQLTKTLQNDFYQSLNRYIQSIGLYTPAYKRFLRYFEEALRHKGYTSSSAIIGSILPVALSKKL